MIFLQPVPQEAEQYMKLADKYGLGFELMDLAFAAGLDGAAKRVKSLYKKKYMCSCHGVFADINYSGSDPWVFQVSEKRIRQCIEEGRKLGISKYVFHSCFHPVLKPDDPLYDEWSLTFSQLFVSMAEEYQVDFYMENVLDKTPAILEKMMRRADHPRIHVCLDVGHVNVAGGSLDVWLAMLHPYISYFHLSDNKGVYDDHMAVGDGTVDFVRLKSLIDYHHIQADYTLEVSGTAAVEKSIAALTKMYGEEMFHAG